MHGASQGSILGPLIFGISLVDKFYECEHSEI